jgi:hypothetical protein
MDLIFFGFWQYWSLNSGPSAWLADNLPFKPLCQSLDLNFLIESVARNYEMR